MDREKMILCVCGLAGSGKSTVAKRLARHYKLKYLSGGDALKAVAADMGYKVTCKGWWESEEGRRFIEERERNLEIDRKVDEKLLKWARKGGVVLDSWAIPWLVKEGFKVWLEASENERARRVAQRDDLSLEDAVRFIREKEEKTKAIYKKLYGFNLGEDFTPFNLIIDVENLDKDEVYQALRMVIDNLVLKEKHS
jgi:cytidylate kinase